MSSKLICMGAGPIGPDERMIYTVSDPGKAAMITELLLTSNTETETCSISLWVIPAGQATGDAWRILNKVELLPTETRFVTLATVVMPGEKVVIRAHNGSPTYRVSGLEVSNV